MPPWLPCTDLRNFSRFEILNKKKFRMPCKHCSCPLYYARMGYQPVGFRLFNPAATELLSKFLCLPPLELCQYVLLEGNRRVEVFESLKSGVVYDIQRSPKIAAIDGCDVLAKFDQIIQTDGLEIVKNLEMDLDGKSVKRSGKIIELTAKEFLLLEFLLRNQGRVVSKGEISEKVWDLDFSSNTNV